MRNVDWIFTYNHLDGRRYDPWKEIPEDAFTVDFKLYDDDGELYFSGKMSDRLYNMDPFEPLDYARDLWGCTEIRVWNTAAGEFIML